MNRKYLPLTFGATVVMVLALLIGIWRSLGQVITPDGLPVYPKKIAQVEQRVDPNTADEAVLACLPELGEALAKRIVDARRQRQAQNGQTPAFRSPADLLTIKGIGGKTLRQFERYLVFPPVTTQPKK